MSISRYNKYSKKKQLHYSYTIYPQFEVNNIDFIKVIVTSSDRLDLLAKKYFNNSKLWWIIPMVNNLSGDSLMVPVGTQLYIPKDYLKYVY